MSAALPLVSVIVTAYNAERSLARALQSAADQTYPRCEIIVVDDGSRDRTAEVARTFRHLRYPSQPNEGLGAARNRGIRASTGAYITFLDADDLYLPDKVGRQVMFLESHPEYGAAFCDALHFYSRNPRRLYGRRADLAGGDVFRALLRTSLINPNTLMVRADALRGGLFFREDRYYPEAWDLCLRLSRAGVRIGYQPEDLVVVEVRDDSITAMENQWRYRRSALGMFEQLFAEMSDAERTALGAERVLRRCKINLAAAYLANGDNAGFGEVIAEVLPGPRGAALRAVVAPLPRAVVKAAVIRAWRWRQRRSFARRSRPRPGAVWVPEGAPWKGRA